MSMQEGTLDAAKNARDSSMNTSEQDNKKCSPLEKSNQVTSNDNLNAYSESDRDDDLEKAKEQKRTPGEREKSYIWNSNQMMTWTNKQRTLVMRRWKEKFESEQRLYTIMKLVVMKRKESAPTRKNHENPRWPRKSTKNDENDQALVSNEMILSRIGNDIFIGDSAATSHMTNNKT